MSTRGHPWSLRKRVTLAFCLISIAPLTVSTFEGARMLRGSVDRELDALAREEFEEVRAEIGDADYPAEAFAEFAATLASHHPSVTMGWRLVEPGGETRVLGEADNLALLGAEDIRPGEVRQLGAGVRAARVKQPTGLDITLVIDGSGHASVVDRYEWLAALNAAIALILGILSAQLFAGHLRSLLGKITGRLRTRDAADLETLPLELRPVAVELRKMLDAANERALETQRFVAGLAHELRSPIQNLIGQSEVALLQPRTTEVYRDLVESQLEEQLMLANAVDNLIQLCATQDPSRIVRSQTFDLGEEVAIRLQHERRRAETRGVVLEFELRGSLRLRGDRESILRAIRNVVENAIKWSPSDGKVLVAIDGTDKEIVIEVVDQGPGIPEAERASAFVPFARGPDPTGERSGFGLGLAITRTAANQHGGTAEILDAPGGGTRFRMTIPREQTPPPARDVTP